MVELCLHGTQSPRGTDWAAEIEEYECLEVEESSVGLARTKMSFLSRAEVAGTEDLSEEAERLEIGLRSPCALV